MQTFGQLATGQILARRHGFFLSAQELADDVLHGFIVGGKNGAAQQLAHFGLHRRDHLLRLVFVRRLGSNPDIDLTRQGQYADGWIAGVSNQVADLVVHRALADADDLEHTVVNDFRQVEFLSEVRFDLVFEQPFELNGDPWQRVNHPARVLDDKTGRRAVGIFDRDRSFRHIRLPNVVRCHGPAAPAKMLFDLLQHRGILNQLATGHLGNDFPSQIILRWSQSAAGDDDVGAL